MVFLLLVAVIAVAQESKPAAADRPVGWSGDWIGTLDVGATKLRLAFHIVRKGDDYSATMDSLDQGANGITANETTASGESIQIHFKGINGVYDGKHSADFTEISGTWSQNGMNFPLTLKRGVAEPPKRPQRPRPPFPYDAIEVTFDNPQAKGVTLAGTLTVPHGAGPFPVVIMITGSGPQDRDETLLGHKPFLVIADHLSRNGIAVLRYDDRGVGDSKGSFAGATSDDFATDAEAAVTFVKTRKEIDAKRIGLLGHSEGGLVAPIVAVADPSVSFIVLLAGPGLPGEQILDMQRNLIAKAAGVPSDVIDAQNRMAEKVMSLIKSRSATSDDIRAELGTFYDGLSADVRKPLGDREAFITSQLALTRDPWFRHFVTYDPRPTLEKVKCPIFALNGEKDLQVPAERNIAEIEAAVKKGGNKALTTKILPGLNHLFQKCKTGSPDEYATIEETVDPAALDAVTQWIQKTTQAH